MPTLKVFWSLTSRTMILFVGGYFAVQGSNNQYLGLAHAGTLHHEHIALPNASVDGTATDIPVPARRLPDGRKIFRIVIHPTDNAAPNVYQLQKNDVATFSVTVPYDGMLAVHGYTDNILIKANRELTFQLDAKYIGRFPIHVHNKEGQHIEVATLEILPRDEFK
jgi:hypothetical protein